jgi:ElaB/YqjD/DUF883 family membrane-anchored ribosome-binding protein
MDYESEVINKQMEETRSSLQDKLETLEQQVKNTVQDATDAVTGTVDSVKEAVQETVETVKETVQGTVETVKETVQGTVETVKNTFDISQQFQDHPWIMFGGATAVGFIAGRWLMASSNDTPVPPPQMFTATANRPERTNGASRPPQAAAEKSWLGGMYQEELGKLKGLAIGAIGSLVRELVASNVPQTLGEQIKEVVNSFTTKMGGQVMEGSILESFQKAHEHAQSHDQEHEAHETSSTPEMRKQAAGIM